MATREWRSYGGLRTNVQDRERTLGQPVITEVRIVKGFQEEGWEVSNITVERA